MRQDYSSIGTVEDAKSYYEQNFKGMTRGQLSKDVKVVVRDSIYLSTGRIGSMEWFRLEAARDEHR